MAKKPEIVSSPRRNSYHGVEAAAAAWEYKDIAQLDAAGKLIEALTTTNKKVLGQFQSDASGVTSTAAVVDEWFDGDIIAIDCWDSSDGAAEAASSFVPGVAYGLLTVSGEWYADLSGTGIANALIFIRSYGDLRDELTDQTITRGIFRVADGICTNTAGAGS